MSQGVSENNLPADSPIDPQESFASLRQAARLKDVPEIYRRHYERLAVELALDVEDAEAIFKRYGYSEEAAAELVESPVFVAMLQVATKEIFESGLSFRTKAKLIANELLPHAHDIATDPLQSAAVRATLIQWVTKVANLEPKEMKDDGKLGGGLTLSITFAGAAPQQVLSAQHTPLTIEQE